jgi:hypothetical protein
LHQVGSTLDMLGKHMRCLALTFLQLLRVVNPSEGSLPSESWVLEEQFVHAAQTASNENGRRDPSIGTQSGTTVHYKTVG